MSDRFKQLHNVNSNVHFSGALMGEVESSKMTAQPIHITTFNAGDIVPVYCREVLAKESLEIDLDFVIRQTTLLTPTMGNMDVQFFAFFVPNRIVNQSWVNVEGENSAGSWTAPSVTLAPLYNSGAPVQVPVGSVADYYGFPTQQPIPASVLSKCNDLKFRGYVMIYNEFFRDQNYQPPIPMSTLNVYQGFFDADRSQYLGKGNVFGSPDVGGLGSSLSSTGSFPNGAIVKSLYGNAAPPRTSAGSIPTVSLSSHFNALGKPLKANKHHDYFTTVLPSPQKNNSPVYAPVSGQLASNIPVITSATRIPLTSDVPMNLVRVRGAGSGSMGLGVQIPSSGDSAYLSQVATSGVVSADVQFAPDNLYTASGADITGLQLSVDDLRMASAIQQVYEVLARGGSRYRELVRSFFGIYADNPYEDIPTCLGSFSRDLELYQTAQTSPSQSNSTPQGNLAAFGYTSNGGKLFSHTFLEHGYVHIFAVVRHRNLYTSYMSRDNFRISLLDFYMPQLANISEQPVYTYEINPFAPSPLNAFGYQEAWAEYRYEPDMVSGAMRAPAPNNSGTPASEYLSVWNYGDAFDQTLQISNGNWLKSNSEEVLNRTLAVTSDNAPQFKAMFRFNVTKVLPMPTYSVPGMDII